MEGKVYACDEAVIELRDSEIVAVLPDSSIKALLKRPFEGRNLTIVKGDFTDTTHCPTVSIILLMSDGKLYEWCISKKNPHGAPEKEHTNRNSQPVHDTESDEDTDADSSSAEEDPCAPAVEDEEDFYSSAEDSEDLVRQRRKMTKKDKIPWLTTEEEIAHTIEHGHACIYRLASGVLMETDGQETWPVKASASKTKKMNRELENYQTNYFMPSRGYLESWFPQIKISLQEDFSACGLRLIASNVKDFIHVHHDYHDFAIEFSDRRGYYKEIHSEHGIHDAGTLTLIQGKYFREAESFLEENHWRNSPRYVINSFTEPNGIVYKISFIMEEGRSLEHSLLDDKRVIVPETIRVVCINNMNYCIYQDRSGVYHSVPAQFTDRLDAAGQWRRCLDGLVSLHTGEEWFVLYDTHSYADVIIDTYRKRSLRSRVKIAGFRKVLHLALLREHKERRLPVETYVMVIDAEDPRPFIKAKNVALVNIRALAPDYFNRSANTALNRQGTITALGFFYQTGESVMYCPYPFEDWSPPVTTTTLTAGETLFLSTHPTIHTGKKIWIVGEEGRTDVSRPLLPTYPINVRLCDEDEEYEPDSVYISLFPRRNPYDALTQMMETYSTGYSTPRGIHWSIETLGEMISQGDGVGMECDFLVGREIQARYLAPGRLVHFSQSLERMTDHELYVLGRVLYVSSFGNSLPVLPIALYAGIKYGEWNETTKNKVTDADLYYFAGLTDPDRMEHLEEMRLDPAKVAEAGFVSYREALETFCELSGDDQYQRQINLILRGYLGIDGAWIVQARNLGSIRALMTGKDLIDRSKWEIEYEKDTKHPSREKVDRFIRKIMALDEDKIRQLLINWSGSPWLSREPYTIRIEQEDGIQFATCTQVLTVSSKLFRNQDELLGYLTEPWRGFNVS